MSNAPSSFSVPLCQSSRRVGSTAGASLKAPLAVSQSVSQFLGSKSVFPPTPESPAIFSCDGKSQAIAILFAILEEKTSPPRFGWRRGRLRQEIAAICDCDFWCSQVVNCASICTGMIFGATCYSRHSPERNCGDSLSEWAKDRVRKFGRYFLVTFTLPVNGQSVL